MQRKKVKVRQIGRNRLGPVYVLRITYIDGRRTWGVSDSGGLGLFGSDRQKANDFIRRITD